MLNNQKILKSPDKTINKFDKKSSILKSTPGKRKRADGFENERPDFLKLSRIQDNQTSKSRQNGFQTAKMDQIKARTFPMTKQNDYSNEFPEQIYATSDRIDLNYMSHGQTMKKTFAPPAQSYFEPSHRRQLVNQQVNLLKLQNCEGFPNFKGDQAAAHEMAYFRDPMEQVNDQRQIQPPDAYNANGYGHFQHLKQECGNQELKGRYARSINQSTSGEIPKAARGSERLATIEEHASPTYTLDYTCPKNDRLQSLIVAQNTNQSQIKFSQSTDVQPNEAISQQDCHKRPQEGVGQQQCYFFVNSIPKNELLERPSCVLNPSCSLTGNLLSWQNTFPGHQSSAGQQIWATAAELYGDIEKVHQVSRLDTLKTIGADYLGDISVRSSHAEPLVTSINIPRGTLEENPCYKNFNGYTQSVFLDGAGMSRQYSSQKMYSMQAQQEHQQLLRQNSKQNELQQLPMDNFMIDHIGQKKESIRQGSNERATWHYSNQAGTETLSKTLKAYNNDDINDVVGETSRESSQDESSKEQLQHHSVEALEQVFIGHGGGIALSNATQAQITASGSFAYGVGHAACEDSLKNIPPEIAAYKAGEGQPPGNFIPNHGSNLNARCSEADSNPCSNNQVVPNQMVQYESIKNNSQHQNKSQWAPFQGQQNQRFRDSRDQLWSLNWQTSDQINASRIALNLQSQYMNQNILPAEMLKNNQEETRQSFYRNFAETLQNNSQLAQSMNFQNQDIKDRSFMLQTLSAAGGVSDQCNHATLSQRQDIRLALRPLPANGLNYQQSDCGGGKVVAPSPGQRDHLCRKQEESARAHREHRVAAEIDENQVLEVRDPKQSDSALSWQALQINAYNQWYANQIHIGLAEAGGSSMGDSSNGNFNLLGPKFVSFNQAMHSEGQEALPGISEPELCMNLQLPSKGNQVGGLDPFIYPGMQAAIGYSAGPGPYEWQNSQFNRSDQPSSTFNLCKNSYILQDHLKSSFGPGNFDEMRQIATPFVEYSLQIPAKIRLNPRLEAVPQSYRAVQNAQNAFLSSLATAHDEGRFREDSQGPIINLKKKQTYQASRALFGQGGKDFVATTPSKFHNQAVKRASSSNVDKRCKNLVRKSDKQALCKSGTQKPEIIVKLLKKSAKNKLQKKKTTPYKSATDVKSVGQYSFVTYKSPKSGKSSKSRMSNKKRRQAACQQSEDVSNLSNNIKQKKKLKKKNKAHAKKSGTMYRSSARKNQTLSVKILLQEALKLRFPQNSLDGLSRQQQESLQEIFKASLFGFQGVPELVASPESRLSRQDQSQGKSRAKSMLLNSRENTLKNRRQNFVDVNAFERAEGLASQDQQDLDRSLNSQQKKLEPYNNGKRKLIYEHQNNEDYEQKERSDIIIQTKNNQRSTLLNQHPKVIQQINETDSHNKFKLSTVKSKGTRGFLIPQGLQLDQNAQARTSALALGPDAKLNMFIDIPSFSDEQNPHQTQSFQGQTLHQPEQVVGNDRQNKTHPRYDVTQQLPSDQSSVNIEARLQNSLYPQMVQNNYVMQETTFQNQNCFAQKGTEQEQTRQQDGKPTQKTGPINEEQFCESQEESLIAEESVSPAQIEQQSFQQLAGLQLFQDNYSERDVLKQNRMAQKNKNQEENQSSGQSCQDSAQNLGLDCRNNCPQAEHYHRLSASVRHFENYGNQPSYQTVRPTANEQFAKMDPLKNQDKDKYGSCSNIHGLNRSRSQVKKLRKRKQTGKRQKSQYLKSIDRIVNFKSATPIKAKKRSKFLQSQVFPCSSVKLLPEKASLVDRRSSYKDLNGARNNSMILPKKRLITSPKRSQTNARRIDFQDERQYKSARRYDYPHKTATPVRQEAYKQHQKSQGASKHHLKGYQSQEKSSLGKHSKFQRADLVKPKIQIQKLQLDIAKQNSQIQSKTPQSRAEVLSFYKQRGSTTAKRARCISPLCTTQASLFPGGIKHSLQIQLTKHAIQKAEKEKYQIDLRNLQNQAENRFKNQEFLWRNRLKYLRHSISAEKTKVKEYQEQVKEMGDKIGRQDKKKQSLDSRVRTKSKQICKYNQTLNKQIFLTQLKSSNKNINDQQTLNEKKSQLYKKKRYQVGIQKVSTNQKLVPMPENQSLASHDCNTWTMVAGERQNVALNPTQSLDTSNRIQKSRQGILNLGIRNPNESKQEGKMQLQSFADAVNDIEQNSYPCRHNLSQGLEGNQIGNNLDRDNHTDRHEQNFEVQSQLKSSIQNHLDECINVIPLGQASEQLFASKVTFRNNERQNNFTSQSQCRNQVVRQYLEGDDSVNNRSLPRTTEYDQGQYLPHQAQLTCSLRNDCNPCDASRRNFASILTDDLIRNCSNCQEYCVKEHPISQIQPQNITMTEASSTSSQSDDIIFPEKLSSLAYKISQNKREIKRIENILYKNGKKVETNKAGEKNMPLSKRDDQVQEFARKVRELAEKKIKRYSNNMMKQNVKSNPFDDQIFYDKIKKIDKFDR